MPRPASTAFRTVLASAIGLVAATALVTGAGAQATSYSTSSYAARLLAQVNDARQQQGLQPLALVTGTTAVAADWTRHLADAGALSHNPSLADDLASHGSRRWRTYGENVGVGSAHDPDGLFAAYMNSPEHRDNILNSSYRFVGVAVVFTGSRAWNTFDFVDVYGTARAPHRLATHRVNPRPQPQSAASPRPPATAPAAPTQTSHHAARPARQRPVAVRVKALRHHLPAPRQAVLRADVATTPVAALMPRVPRVPQASRRDALAVGLAMLVLIAVARRWVFAVTRLAA